MTGNLTFVTTWKGFLAGFAAYGNKILAGVSFGEILDKCLSARAEFDVFR